MTRVPKVARVRQFLWHGNNLNLIIIIRIKFIFIFTVMKRKIVPIITNNAMTFERINSLENFLLQ